MSPAAAQDAGETCVLVPRDSQVVLPFLPLLILLSLFHSLSHQLRHGDALALYGGKIPTSQGDRRLPIRPRSIVLLAGIPTLSLRAVLQHQERRRGRGRGRARVRGHVGLQEQGARDLHLQRRVSQVGRGTPIGQPVGNCPQGGQQRPDRGLRYRGLVRGVQGSHGHAVQGIHMVPRIWMTGHKDPNVGLGMVNVSISGFDKEKTGTYPKCKTTEVRAYYYNVVSTIPTYLSISFHFANNISFSPSLLLSLKHTRITTAHRLLLRQNRQPVGLPTAEWRLRWA